MAKAKESGLAVIEEINERKPFVKAFIDQDAEIVDFIRVRLPHVPHTVMKITEVYRSSNNLSFRYRINYFTQVRVPDSIIYSNKIIKSRYVEVNLRNSELTLTDVTVN